jgi:predicted aspartyl protease
MHTHRYGYSAALVPTPTLMVSVAKPFSDMHFRMVPGLVDTGADQTVMPIKMFNELGITNMVDEEIIVGFDGTPKMLKSYAVMFQVNDFTPLPLTVLTSDWIDYIIVGRDVLNRYVINLDGPNGKLQITGE